MSQPLTLTHWIGGVRREGPVARERRNPSNLDEVVAVAPEAAAVLVDEAVAAAAAAQPAWAEASPEARSDILDRAGAILFEEREAVGRLLAREEGKTLPEAIGEAARAARILKFFAGEALRRTGMTVDSVRPGVDAATYRQAVGVFGLITPWNFPIAIPAWKTAPALAFGNAVVLKPSELTPALADVLAQVLGRAGLPAGVFNLVQGAGATGAALVGHRGVQGVSFTGSQATGSAIAAETVRRQARLQMEMGGKNPLVVLADADLDLAVRCALDGAFFASGQRCTASSRIIVEARIHDAFLERLAEAMRSLTVGDALDPATRIGPLASQAQYDKVRGYLEIAAGEGAELLSGPEPATTARGWFQPPVLLAGATGAMRTSREEIFGPVGSVLRASDYDEALTLANAGDVGLSAGIVTDSLSKARHFQRHVRTGMVMVNLATAGVDYHVPFGGVAGSSYGPREQGQAAIEFYTQLKTAYVAGS
jgi:aldehyde dehydrogenase (NAD+)